MEAAAGAAQPGGGIWAKNLNPSCRGLVSGVLCKKAVDGGAGRWLVWENGMEMAGGAARSTT
jgi:hypothetical protein